MHYDAKQFLQKRFSAQPRGTVIQASPTPWTRLLRTSQWHLPPVLVTGQPGGIFLRGGRRDMDA